MKPLLISSGEPAGIGPDLCLALAQYNLPVVVIADKQLLLERAKQLNIHLSLIDYHPDVTSPHKPNSLTVLSLPCSVMVEPGILDPLNASYVVEMLTTGVARCLSGEFSGLVTAPVNKAVINQAGFNFTGHTEFFADYCNVKTVVMMLACDMMKVALVTTHLPLKDVSSAISYSLVIDVITTVNNSLINGFGIACPTLLVAGLNPHAGESGYLGREEIDTITPAINELKKQGIDVHGPLSADTLFTPKHISECDAFIAMYHDQGLPVLKHAGFGHAVNITLGLPIIRTSVDHGTALDLAGTGRADESSLFEAVKMALYMAKQREQHDHT